MAQADLMDKIVALAKRRGFIFQSPKFTAALMALGLRPFWC